MGQPLTWTSFEGHCILSDLVKLSSDAAEMDINPKHKVMKLRETYSCTEHSLMSSVRPLDWQHYQRSLYGSPKRRFHDQAAGSTRLESNQSCQWRAMDDG